ncbi:MAG: TonB-dependent receptor [Bacteroidetes bacterium]|nr:TonB-dependent receptor [Bacteroidota bacterium]
MKNRYLVIIILFIIPSLTFAQNTGLSGRLFDTTYAKPVVYATVSAIRKSDSILVKHTRTNQQGKFVLSPLPVDTYILLTGHANYVDFVDEIILNKTDSIQNLGDYDLLQRGQVLRNVIITNKAGIKVKGDTLEYLADSFKVKQGAMVEDLLKVLPGIQVNKKGEITAMGEKVEKVLVDGEEFFGDDPTVATQNIQSKVVDKVQVFDKKSEQATFTGFDDGEEQKTINLKLKDNMNRGTFGKIELGAGLDDRWQNQAMINRFKNKQQMSAYALMSSNGKTGLGWEDRSKYTGSNSGMQMDEDGGFMWTMSDDDDDGSNWRGQIPEGITKAYVGGLHFADKWNENKQHLNTNYSFGRINKEKRERSLTENLFPGNTFETGDTTYSYSSRNTHRLSGRYEFTVDSSLSIIYNLSGRLSFSDWYSTNQTANVSSNEIPISIRNTINNNTSVTSRINNSLTVNKKFKKTGRTISLNSSFNYQKNTGEGELEGNNAFTVGGNLLGNVIDQQKEDDYLSNVLSADLTYTEPLAKKILLKTSYGISSDKSESGKKTFEKPIGGTEYSDLIDSLSNEYDLSVVSHTVGAELKYTEKKYNVTVGSKVRYSIFKQEDLIRNQQFNYNRINLFPTLRFNYKFDQFRRFTFSYSGSTRNPSISQVQPVQDNTNPLNIIIGNPNLKIGFNQNVNINYFSYKVLSARSLYAGIYGGNSINAISTNRTFDEQGRTVTTYVNLNGGYNASIWGGINAKIPKTPLEGKLNINGSMAHTPNIINDVKGTTNTQNITLTPGLRFAKDEKFDFNIDCNVTYNNTTSTLQASRNIRFISLEPTASISITLPKNIELETDADYMYNPPVGPYANSFNRFIWNGAITYTMLPKKNLEWRASMNDILNQNTGYERTSTNNYNTERYFQTLGRYWMIGMVWNFNTGPMAASQSSAPRPPRGMGGGRRRMGR